ncbi:heme exporter protein CcmD [Ignatzschineria larvae DSM 13226]|uniref:Heme exporter protein D n=1 Tax=Ignatzschineria larvae DSM 13226 TaxID=1111732 RepID=A0ABZ3C011_9GAMM|nr:heme exporter protein CcmD [Ignatzschineria larvae]
MSVFLDLLNMGKHTAYVWSCYGFVAICLIGLIVALIMEGRNLKKAMLQEGVEYGSK